MVRLVKESLNERNEFKRGLAGKELRDTLTNRIMTLDLQVANIELDENGDPDLEDEETDYFIDVINKSGVRWTLDKFADGGIEITMTGTKEQLIQTLDQWDPYGRSKEELAIALKDWGPDNVDDLWDILDI